MNGYLVTIEVETSNHVYTRTVYSDYCPSDEEVSFYYKDLCGFEDASTDVSHISVPEDFNMSLLTFGDARPTQFPKYDILTEPDHVDRRAKYHAYIQQLGEMEKSRADLKHTLNTPIHIGAKDAHTETAATATETSVHGVSGRYKLKQQDWVKDLLESLDSDEVLVGDELAPIAKDGVIPHAWILTPVVPALRTEKGSRILVDPILGQHWERRLGTALFPDFIVSRRVSSHSWTFQHNTSDVLVKALLDYYIASQDATIVRGMTGWIPLADKEMGMMLQALKRIKVNERLLTHNGDPNHIFNLLASIESQCLASKAENPTVVVASVAVFRKYVNYVAQVLNIPREQYVGVEMVNQILRRWERALMGFRGEVDPIVPAWVPMWRAVMRINPSPERLTLFLTTLDAWNPMEGGTLMTLATRQEIARQWIRVYIDNELILESKAYESSVILYTETGKWCLQFLPADAFRTSLRDEANGKEYTRLGFKKNRPHGYLVVCGVKFRNPPAVLDPRLLDPVPGRPYCTKPEQSTHTVDDTSDTVVSDKSDTVASDKPVMTQPATKTKTTKATKDAKQTVVIKAESGITPINELIMNLGSL
jgi:hypothetical protein